MWILELGDSDLGVFDLATWSAMMNGLCFFRPVSQLNLSAGEDERRELTTELICSNLVTSSASPFSSLEPLALIPSGPPLMQIGCPQEGQCSRGITWFPQTWQTRLDAGFEPELGIPSPLPPNCHGVMSPSCSSLDE